jgi:hypothetical protein
MADRRPHSVRLDPDVYSRFVDWVEETEGRKRNEVGRHVENALEEYIDHGREARIEEKVDELLTHIRETDGSHTHTPRDGMSSGSDSIERVRKICRRLQSNHDDVLKDEHVTQAIEDIAGVDDRTVRKYKRLLRKRGLLFEHPGERPQWTFETSIWNEWLVAYGNVNGPDEVDTVLEPYPANMSYMNGSAQIEINRSEELIDT